MSTAAQPPRLSLVVSTIGRVTEFARLLDSLVADPDNGQIELILVDQSADQRCAAHLAAAQPPFQWRAITSGRGAAVGHNAGAALASASLIAFPDDDCWYPPGVLGRVLTAFDQDPQLAALCGRQMTEDMRPSALRWSRRRGRVTRTNWFRRHIMSSMFLSREWFLKTGGFDEGIGIGSPGPWQSGDETDILLRILAHSGRVQYDPRLTIHHADERWSTSPSYPVKMHGYGVGVGALWRRHDLPRSLMAYLIVRKLVAIAFNTVRGKRYRAAADRAWVNGWLTGYRGPLPTLGDIDSSADQAEPVATGRREPFDEARRSYGLRFVAAGIGLPSTFATTIVVVRTLGSTDAATYLSILAALFIGPMIGRLGLGQNAMRLLAAEQHDERTVSTHLAATAALSGLSAPIVAYVATFALHSWSQRLPVMALTSVLIVLEALRLTMSDIFAALGLVGMSVLTTHHVRSFLTIAALLLYVALVPTATLMGVLWVALAIAVATVLLPLRQLSRHVNPFMRPTGLAGVRTAVTASVVLFVVDFAAFVVGRGDVWLASSAFNGLDAARYGAASVIAYQVMVPIGLAALAISPIIARLWAQERRADLRALLDAISTVAVAITVPLVVLIWVLGPPAMQLGYGDRYRSAGVLLGILASGTVVAAATSVSPALLMMTGKSRPAAMTVLASLALVIPAGILAAYLGGPTALAVVSSSATAFVALALWVCSWVTLGFAATPRLRVRSAVELFRGTSLVSRRGVA